MYLTGEDINIGLGVETVRGTGVVPAVFIPGRTPSGVNVEIEKTLIKETRATKVSSQGSEIVRSSAAGDLEFNIRVSSLGYILKSLLGSVTSALQSGESAVYKHIFKILAGNPQHPSLTLALSKPGIQDYEYPLALAKSLEIKTPMDDLIYATVAFLAQKENTHAAYTPAFAGNDYYFRHQDVVISLADDLSGLAAATPIKVKSFQFNIDNKARQNQNVSELNPGDIIATDFTLEGQMSLDLQDSAYHDLFTSGNYKALELKLQRGDITIGSASNPTVQIQLPKISIESYSENRKLEDVTEQTLKFTAHYSPADSMAIQAILINEKANYNS